jgi:hypothetical protein
LPAVKDRRLQSQFVTTIQDWDHVHKMPFQNPDHCCLINIGEKEARRALWWYNDFAKRSYKPRRSEPWPRAIPS